MTLATGQLHGEWVGVRVSCPRCGGPVRPPDLMHSAWRCDDCGPVPPLYTPQRINDAVLRSAVAEVSRHPPEQLALWCPWPLPSGWTVTGVGWVGDERGPVRATMLACAGPSPLTGGPADLLLISESPGVGLASRLAGLRGVDPGPEIAEAVTVRPGDAKVRASGHPTPLWSIPSPEDRSAYVGEAGGVWLTVIAWPASAGYLLAENLVLCDLVEYFPGELVYGAISDRLSS